jgi:hypothetical protein
MFTLEDVCTWTAASLPVAASFALLATDSVRSSFCFAFGVLSYCRIPPNFGVNPQRHIAPFCPGA